MAKRKGHGFWSVTPEGHSVHIKGDPDMPQETLQALLSMMDLAYKNAAKKMPCGHSRADIVSSDEGTAFCGQCAEDAAAKE